MKINIASNEVIHFIGIGGIGMSGLAQIMNNMGFTIQGSDLNRNKNTDRLIKTGIEVFFGHHKKNLNKIFEFVGPICESTDKFLTINKFQKIKEGDVLIICDSGAYGMSLSSNYNSRPIAAEILVTGSKQKLIRKRQSLENLVNN